MVFGLQKLQDELFCMTEERNYFQGKYLEQVSEIAALKDELRKARREILKLRGELMETSSTSLLMGFAADDSSSWNQQQQQEDGGDNNNNFQTPPKNNRRRSRRTSSSTPQAAQENVHQEEKKETDLEDEDGGSSGISQQRNLQSPASTDEPGNLDDGGEKERGDRRVPREEDENFIEYDEDDDDDDDEDNGDEDTEAADIRQSAEKLLQWASYRSYARTSSTNSPVDQGSVSGSVSSGRSSLGGSQRQQESLLGPMIPSTIDSASLKNSISQGSLVVEAATPEAEAAESETKA